MKLHDDRGAIALLTAILVPTVFIALCSLVVDLGLGRDSRRQSQNAADASALAAAEALYLNNPTVPDFTTAIAQAKSYVAKNLGLTTQDPQPDWAGCQDAAPLAYHPDSVCISFDNPVRPTTVRVVVPIRQVPTFFARIWGIQSVPVGAVANAQFVPGGRAGCGVCVIGPGTHDLQNGTLNVAGANVAFNGTLIGESGGSISVTDGQTYLQGPMPEKGTYLPTPIVGQAAIADPLATLSMPDISGLLAGTNSCSGPGVYDKIRPNCTMAPGLYVFTGSTTLGGSDAIVGNGVTIFFMCGSPTAPRACNSGGESGGALTMSGNASLTITAPTIGPTQGLAILSDRNNTSTISFRGNGVQGSTGTIYAASGTVNYRGNGAGTALNSLIVSGDISFAGNPSAFNSLYSDSLNVSIPFGNLHLADSPMY